MNEITRSRDSMHEATIDNIVLEPSSGMPVLILKAKSFEGDIPIWIGYFEASAIAAVMQGVEFDRPMTHDLFKNFISVVNMSVAKVELVDIIDNAYRAKIHFISRNKVFDMDARPSDALAMAVRFKSPIFVSNRVLDKSRSMPDKYETFDGSDDGKKWEEYLKNLSPEAFGKYKI